MTRKEKSDHDHSKGKQFAKTGAKTIHDEKKPGHDPEHAKEKEHVHDKEKVHEHEKEKTRAALKASEEKYQELHDKYLRLSAEFDNYRKRTLKERTELIKTAGDDLLKRILPVMDNFERALKAMDQSEDIKALKDGVVLIYNHFRDFVQQQGVKEIPAMNEPFNLDFHEAVTTVPVTSDEMKGKVIDVIEKGYTLHEKVIRYAKVVVGG